MASLTIQRRQRCFAGDKPMRSTGPGRVRVRGRGNNFQPFVLALPLIDPTSSHTLCVDAEYRWMMSLVIFQNKEVVMDIRFRVHWCPTSMLLVCSGRNPGCRADVAAVAVVDERRDGTAVNH